MAEHSTIEWTDATWNPIRGCTRVSPGCGGPGPHGGCYAERVAARFSGPGQPYEGIAEMRGGKPRWTGNLIFVEHLLTLPLQRRRPTTWFVNSMSDLFHESVSDASIDRVFAVMALCPQHTFQVLTKRSGRMREYLTRPHAPGKFITIADDGSRSDTTAAEVRVRSAVCDLFGKVPARALNDAIDFQDRHHPGGDGFMRRWPLPSVWLGVSVEDQARADERIPDLLATPAAVRFVSAEPLLSGINFTRITLPGVSDNFDALHGSTWCTLPRTGERFLATSGKPRLDWIIVGDESGPKRREVDLDHVRSIRDQCDAAGTAFFLKQLHVDGKKVSLPELDGVQHFAMPSVSLRGRS